MRVWVGVIVCLSVGICFAQDSGPTALSEVWRFSLDEQDSGLSKGWEQPGLDDSAWRELRIDSNYESQGVSYDGYSWYRLRFSVPASLAGQPLLLELGPIDDADETYLNGALVGRTGIMGDMATTRWEEPRRYVLPPGAIRADENVLAVRVWDQRGGGGIYKGPVQLSKLKSLHADVVKVILKPWGAEFELANGMAFRLQFYGDGVLRVRAAMSGAFRPWLAHELILDQPEPTNARFSFRETADSTRLETENLRVRVDLRPFRLNVRDGNGKRLTRQSLQGWYSDTEFSEALTCRRDEHFLGLGEPGPHVDRRGHRAFMWVIHSYNAEDIPVPFYLSSAGYGVLLCNSFRGQFDLACMRPDQVSFGAQGGELDYFIIAGEQPKQIIGRYTWLTGRSKLPPKWAFGYWQSRAGHGLPSWVTSTVTRLRESGFPLDVLHMDGWSDGDLKFSERRFKDPAGLMDWLRERNVKLCIWETPFFGKNWKLFEDALARGFFATREDGSYYSINTWMGRDQALIDFANPETCAWWQSKHIPVLNLGVGAVKTDGGDTHEVPADAHFHDGLMGHEVHNLYPLLFNRCVYEGQQRVRPGKRVINWTRTGYAGIQRYPCQWGGDEPSTFVGGRTLVRAGINAGVCGISFWGHDLGGFAYGRTMEYYVRSCQWGFLSPLARIHGMGVNADADIKGNEPWVFGKDAEEIVRRYARLRYRLLPYIYSYAHETWESGVPIMRALPLEFPGDERAYACDYEYMLGGELLVAPIVQPSERDDLSATRSVYLPEGQWYDFWTDEKYEGPVEITYEAALETLPVFVRAGAIIPMGPDVDHIAGPPSEELTVHVYAGPSSAFYLYEDDGTTLGYADGEYAVTRIAHRTDAGQGSLVTVSAPAGAYSGMPAQRSITVEWHGMPSGLKASANGKAVSVSTEARVTRAGPISVKRGLRMRLGSPQ